MTFSDRHWTHRYEKLGDEAEGVFEEVWAEPFVRAGHARPPFSIQKLPLLERYRPDYLTPTQYVECLGVGRDQIVKVKVEKYGVLQYWNGVQAVEVFVWDSHKKRWSSAPLDDITKWIDAGKASLGYFPEQKAYVAVPTSCFTDWRARS